MNDTSSVSKFSVAAWFKTSADFKSDAFIVNKPGSSNNMNYGIWMTNAEKIRGGFETSGGSPMFATSPLSYSDGKWHYATVTFDGSVYHTLCRRSSSRYQKRLQDRLIGVMNQLG